MTTLTHDFDLSLRDVCAMIPKNQIFCLVDENTHRLCLPLLQCTLALPSEQILVIPAGDKSKNLDTLTKIWDFLFAHNVTRHSLLLCLGGGMVTDIGGMAASTYMRGMSFVNIPTTLLADVDAAAGGKTAINYGGLKNSVGLFAQPKKVIVNVDFLKTLPKQEFLSGFAEMLKHALLSSPLELNRLLAYDMSETNLEELSALIERNIVIKSYIVDQDPEETGMRKTLNFGHTIGHALEELALQKGKALTHGYAVFYGLIAELYLSVKKLGLQKSVLERCLPLLYEVYGKPECNCSDQDQLFSFMQHDKKNDSSDSINFTLLKAVGNAWINQTCSRAEISEALDFLFSL